MVWSLPFLFPLGKSFQTFPKAVCFLVFQPLSVVCFSLFTSLSLFCPWHWGWSSLSRVYLGPVVLTAVLSVCVASSLDYLQMSLLMASWWFQQADHLISQGLLWYAPQGTHGLVLMGCWWRRANFPGYALCSHPTEYLHVLLSLSEMPSPGQFLLVLQVSNQASLPPGSSLVIQTGLRTGFFHNQPV